MVCDMILTVTGVLDSVHRPEIYIIREHGVSETVSVSVLG
jgi:hypothetical protein